MARNAISAIKVLGSAARDWPKNSFFSKKKTWLERKHQRYSCYYLATVKSQNNSTFLDGVITNISRTGLRFRPAKTYVLDRRGEQVLCIFSDFRLPGKIVSTGVSGYGIVLHREIEEQPFVDFIELQKNTDLSQFQSSIG